MRFARLVPALALPLLAIACGQDNPLEPDPPQFDVQGAGGPISESFSNDFWDVNPCTGEWHHITLTGTTWKHEHNNNWVWRTRVTATTSDGFEGSGHSTELGNSAGATLYKTTANNVLTHPSGAKLRAHYVFLLDWGTSPWTVKVDKSWSTCVRH
jgi:hypothetical protein